MYLKTFLLWFDHFLDPWAEICQIFGGFLENLKNQKDILKLSNLYNKLLSKKVLFAKSNLTEMKYCENSGFVVLELVVRSCKQELFLRKYKKLNKTWFNCQKNYLWKFGCDFIKSLAPLRDGKLNWDRCEIPQSNVKKCGGMHWCLVMI